MPALQEPLNPGDLLKYEAPNRYSREHVIVAAGQSLPLGTVVSRDHATGYVNALDPAGSNGNNIAIGVLIHDADASVGNTDAVIIARHAIVFDDVLVWPEGISDSASALAKAQLGTAGIIPRPASSVAGSVAPDTPDSENTSSPHPPSED